MFREGFPYICTQCMQVSICRLKFLHSQSYKISLVPSVLSLIMYMYFSLPGAHDSIIVILYTVIVVFVIP